MKRTIKSCDTEIKCEIYVRVSLTYTTKYSLSSFSGKKYLERVAGLNPLSQRDTYKCFCKFLLYIPQNTFCDPYTLRDRILNHFLCTVKPVLSGHSKRTPILVFNTDLSLNAGQKYCRMLQREHSAIHLTLIKIPDSIKTFVLCIFKWPLKTGFTVSLF